MITTFAVDENNDIFLDENGNVAMLVGMPAVLQLCDHAAKTILGEMVLAVNEGVPYFQTVWKDGEPNIAAFEAALRKTLIAVEGVENVSQLQISITSDILTYVAVIVNIYGTGNLNGNIPL